MRPKIYGDYNGPYAPIFVFVLDRFGTLWDLNDQKLKLVEGLELTVCDEDMEVDGIVKFGQLPGTHMTPPAWYLEGDETSFRRINWPASEEGEVSKWKAGFILPCFSCGGEVGLKADREVCPHCGFDIWHAVRPPG